MMIIYNYVSVTEIYLPSFQQKCFKKEICIHQRQM